MEQPPPEVLALILADQAYRDEIRGKYFILGARFWIGATGGFPYTHPRLAVYVALVNGRGATSLQVRLVDVDEEEEPIAVAESEVTFPDPLTEMEVVFSLNDLVFPGTGTYQLQLHANGQFLRERRLVIFPLPGPGPS
jgi:hypothetical protein